MNLRSMARTVVIAQLIISFSWLHPYASAQDKIRLGHSSIGATNGSFWVADEKGLFKKHGEDVEVIFIGGRPPTPMSPTRR
ncbi:MAG TPA: hypothetical protein VLA17_00290 [Candidatus Limnocylindria bacterium]|nr:hypothetical protein [Candidatus Limnocylindria bacterium]